MFGHESKPSRIWKYDAKPPHGGADVVERQISLAHKYQHRLCEIERARRAACDAAVLARHPDLDALRVAHEAAAKAVEDAEAAIRREHSKERKRTLGTPEQREALKAARAASKEAWTAYKTARKAAYAGDEVRADLKAIDDASHAERLVARRESGLYWGNYISVEQAMQGARSGPPPKFRRWTGDGAVTVQVQGGLSWAEATLGGDKRLRVLHAPNLAPGVSKRGRPLPAADPDSRASRETPRYEVWVRVGSEEAGRAPVWARAYFRLTRVPPPEARIKWVHLRRVMAGPCAHWQVQFVLSADDWPKDAADNGACGVDVGWRMVPPGLRVAYLVGDDGDEDQLVLPHKLLGSVSFAASIRSERDLLFNATRDGLLARVHALDAPPDWLAEESKHMSQWRSPTRLTRLFDLWKANRFDGDADEFGLLEAWRRRDWHLHAYAAGVDRKARAIRDDLYRKFARKVARRYRTVYVEDTNWRELKALPAADEADALIARLNVQFASPGLLTRFLREAAEDPRERDHKRTTQECHACGHRNRFDQSRLVHTCDGCGATWDQDRNAAANLLHGPRAAPAEVA